MAMSITYASLMAYITSLKNPDGSFSAPALNKIAAYIINGGLTTTVNTQKSNFGGKF